MKARLILFVSIFFISNCFAQLTFQKRYGGSRDEVMTGLARAFDGGYVLSGGSGSFGDTLGDAYIIKTDTAGTLLWSMIYHGDSSDESNKIIETTDHGLLLIGKTYSFGAGSEDAFLMKTDSAGNLEWAKTYGGAGQDFFFNAIQTADGGYIAVGSTNSFGAGDNDMFIVRTNAVGDTLWTKIFGGIHSDQALDVIQIADSGFVIAGRTQSFGVGFQDAFLCRLSSSGDTLWTRVFGGSNGQQEAISLKQTYDGGYIVTGSTTAFTAQSYDAYLNRFDSTGTLMWSKTYGGPAPDATYNVLIMSDSGYALLGFTNSFGPTGNARTEGDDGSDTYIIRTDANGDTLWTREYGGHLQDESYGFLKKTNDGLVALGFSSSFGNDSTDAYLIQTDASGNTGCNEKATNPVVASPASITGSAAVQIASGISVSAAPFSQLAVSSFSYTLCSSLGVDDENGSSSVFTLYPNPASNQIIVNTSSFHANEVMILSIMNVFAQEVSPPTPLHMERGGALIDVSKLATGMYFLEMKSKSGNVVKKFVKE